MRSSSSTGPAAADAVLVDVGGGTGAVVVYLSDEVLGQRVDLVDDAGRGPHVDVLERRVPGGSIASAVFGSIPAGSYAVVLRATDGARRLADVRVDDGSISEVDLRGGA